MPSTALCLLGSVRTLALECTGATTVRRLAAPIGAAVFAFVNVPQEWDADRVEGVRALIRAMVRDANLELRALEVDNRSPNSAFKGMAQAKGLKRCWEIVGAPGEFEYIVRVRTDVYHSFSLPSRLPNGPPMSVAYVGFLGAPGCSKRRKHAMWVDDRFAVLRGRQAQRIFLQDFANALQALPLTTTTTTQVERAAAPECLLGVEVDYANAQGAETAVELRDVRKMIAKNESAACTRANAQIIRANCSTEVSRAPWVCPFDDSHPPPVLVLA